ncbi:hypothetical protein KQX54_005163 [Cotesia glomerata]|uniref:Secreted protein n=1 Tax=Cotesia glomerata TaxID=32391 RepID=A0AAV7HW53_COTGL|nr:hypothetical protein KQX54_005163 [Cotesia glomerata]
MRGRGLVVLLRTARELSARVSSLDSWQAGRHARVRRSYRWMPDGGWQWSGLGAATLHSLPEESTRVEYVASCHSMRIRMRAAKGARGCCCGKTQRETRESSTLSYTESASA